MPDRRPDDARLTGLAPAPGQPSEAMWTALRYFALSRLVVAAALLAGVLAGSPLAPLADRAWLVDGLVGYCAIALGFLLATPRLRPHFTPQVVAQVVIDLVFLAGLSEAWGGLGGGIAVLQVAILAAAAVVSTRAQAAGFAALLALLLLGRASWHVLVGDGDPLQVFQAGLVGAAGFVTALLVNWLALRLERAARLAQVRGEDLRAQLLVTRLVIAELQQGVLVFAADGSLRAINRAGAELLRLPESVADSADPPPVPADTALWRMLQTEGEALRGIGDARELQLPGGPGTAARRVLLRVLSPPQAIGGFVLLVEDLRRVEEQARQLKLASMGRLSASIAHEVRNPLAAIRHANGLLAEQVEDPGLRRLTGIVEGNTLRIDRIVEDVLSISRRAPAHTEALDAGVWLPELVAELVAGGAAAEGRIACLVDSPAPLVFDPDHLRQVMVNLVGNALRHAGTGPGAVRVCWHRRVDDRLELAIEDDGPGVSPDMLEHLFEPFLTTEARGTGLGLYLARELCNANGAALRYEPPGADRRSRFVIEPAAQR